MLLTTNPVCKLKEIDTGYNNKFAYGVQTRKVAVSRGGREGNNAFVYDLQSDMSITELTLKTILEIGKNSDMLKVLIGGIPSCEDSIINKVEIKDLFIILFFD